MSCERPRTTRSLARSCLLLLAQQQGISMNTALKKAEGPVSDTWLVVAEFGAPSLQR